MATLTHTESATSYDVPDTTTWSPTDRAWLAGDQRYTDPDGTQYDLTPAAPSIPLIGPIAFQMLFTVPELVAIDAARDGVPAIRIFWRLLDDPRTDYVDRNIAPVQSMLHSLEAGGLLGEGRANEIIHATS